MNPTSQEYLRGLLVEYIHLLGSKLLFLATRIILKWQFSDWRTETPIGIPRHDLGCANTKLALNFGELCYMQLRREYHPWTL